MSNSSVFPLEIQELRRPGSAIRIDVKCFTSIKDIKAQLQKDNKYPLSRMQLYHSVGSKCLSNDTTLHDLGITTAGGVLLLAYVFSSNPQFMLMPAKDMFVDELCEEMIHQVRVGLRSGHLPAKTDMLDCTGGVYFMKGAANTPAAVFKPSDEEQGMPNNPKGYAGNGDYGLRPFFKPGEGYIRETASYILDFQNFCNVPPTIMAHCEHDCFNYPRNQTGQKTMYPKIGSLQKFVPSGDTFEDIGHSLVGVLELQKIALLDMRLLNCDRNASNMLAIRKPAGASSTRSGGSAKRKSDVPRKYSRSSSLGTASDSAYDEDAEIDLDDFLDSAPAPEQSRYSDTYALVPIDHGYCLPSHLRIDELDWAWFHCPHVAVEVQPEIRDYVNSIDIDALLADLTHQLPISEDCLFLLRTVHAVIKEGIAAGLTLRDIAAIIARTDEDVPSPLENAIAAAEDNAQRTIEMRAGAGRRNTTSPSFMKSMQESAGIASIVSTTANATVLHPAPGFTSSLRGDELSSPGPVIVKQKSVGSPRSGGTRSPPQRIGAIQRVSSGSPSATSPSDAGGNESDGYSIGSGAGNPSSRSRNVVPGGATAKRDRSKSDEIDDDLFPVVGNFASPITRGPIAASAATSAGVGGLVRPFPLRTTPPERQRRVVSSELNLEAIGQCSPPPAPASGGTSARAGPDGRGSSYSLSSSSRSPIPQHAEHFASKLGGSGSNKVNIGYLSSENIQRLQSSPAMAAPRFPEFLFRDPPRQLPSSVGADTARSTASPMGAELGDYFMKDLSLPTGGSVSGSADQLRVELPAVGLRSGSAASSPHRSGSNSAFTVHQGSKERMTGADSSEKLLTQAFAAPIASSGSAKQFQTGAFGSSHSVAGSSNSSSGSISNMLRPRPGDPLFTLQSFDEDYKRQQTRAAVVLDGAPASRAADWATAPVSVPVSAPIVHQGRGGNSLPPPSPNRKAATPGMSVVLFASDSDLMSHSTGTSYESSWSGESPKMSPKVPPRDKKSIASGTDAGDAAGGQNNPLFHGEKIAVPIRNAYKASSQRPAAGISETAADMHHDGAAGSSEDCAVLLTMPLKDEDEACRRERACSSVELMGTDTDGEEPPSPPLRQANSIVHSAVKAKMPKEPPKSNKITGADDPAGRSPGPAPYKLSRVTSFAAFESPPLYELPKAERQMTRLRQERRKVIATTAEFQELRLAFSKEMIRSLLRNNKTVAF